MGDDLRVGRSDILGRSRANTLHTSAPGCLRGSLGRREQLCSRERAQRGHGGCHSVHNPRVRTTAIKFTKKSQPTGAKCKNSEVETNCEGRLSSDVLISPIVAWERRVSPFKFDSFFLAKIVNARCTRIRAKGDEPPSWTSDC